MILKPFAARCGKCLLVVGLAFFLISFIPSGGYGHGTHVDYGTYQGRVFNAAGNVHMNVYTYTTKGLCFYILTYNDLIVALEDASLENTHPLIAMEGVTNFSLDAEIPMAGLYVYLATPCENETIYYHVEITRLVPHMGLLLVGIALASGGLAIFLIILVATTMKRYSK